MLLVLSHSDTSPQLLYSLGSLVSVLWIGCNTSLTRLAQERECVCVCEREREREREREGEREFDISGSHLGLMLERHLYSYPYALVWQCDSCAWRHLLNSCALPGQRSQSRVYKFNTCMLRNCCVGGFQGVWPNFFQLPVLMLMLITVLNDGTLIAIGYDNVIPNKRPDKWNLRVSHLITSFSLPIDDNINLPIEDKKCCMTRLLDLPSTDRL